MNVKDVKENEIVPSFEQKEAASLAKLEVCSPLQI